MKESVKSKSNTVYNIFNFQMFVTLTLGCKNGLVYFFLFFFLGGGGVRGEMSFYRI